MSPPSESATVQAVMGTARPPQGDGWDYLVIAAIFASMFALAWAALATPLLQPLLEIARRQHWTMLWVRPTVIWIAVGVLLLFLRTILWLLYRPFAAVRAEEAPALTVIIPAYNEGKGVEHAIASVAAAHYPRGRLQIIAVDDGSTDDTWHHIQNAARRYAGLVTPVRLPVNLGKRGALSEGFRRATGEIIVTVDSDSVIERGALLAIAGPFRDPRIGAVAGKVAVHNRRAGPIPRMLHVRFVLSFDYLRRAQSVFRTVYCCPGALAAYRASVARRGLPRWGRQRVLRAARTFWGGRALPNHNISLGFHTGGPRPARVLTL